MGCCWTTGSTFYSISGSGSASAFFFILGFLTSFGSSSYSSSLEDSTFFGAFFFFSLAAARSAFLSTLGSGTGTSFLASPAGEVAGFSNFFRWVDHASAVRW